MKWTKWISIFSLFMLYLIQLISSSSRCLKEVVPRRFFQLENEIHNITIESSTRLGHRLVSEVFRIFLTEVLGYESVNVVVLEDFFNATGPLDHLISSPSDLQPESIPRAMINLGVWISHDFDMGERITRGYVQNCGQLGFPGRFGWFTLRNSSLTRARPSLPLDYWRSYQNSDVTRFLSMGSSDMVNVTRLLKDPRGDFYCKLDDCTQGLFEPESCQTSPESCALLLHSYPEISPYLHDEISSLNLRIRIAYLGPNLDSFVRHMVTKYEQSREERAVLFFSWKPDLLTTDYNLLSVSLPACNDDSYCNYESAKLEKFVWTKLEEGGKMAHEAVHRATLTLRDYTSMLDLYREVNGSADIETVACQWIQHPENEGVWRAWTSGTTVEKPAIYIGGIFPISGIYTDPATVNAASFATEAVNRDNSVLKDYNLKLYIQDGQCRADKVMKTFIDYIRHPTFLQTAGILGPACSDTVEPLAGVATHFKTVVISYSAEGSSFSDRETYPYFFRTIGGNKQYLQVYLKLFQTLGWNRVASLTEEGQKYAEYVSHLHDLLQQNNIAFIANRKFPKEALNMSQYLEDLKSKQAKIIIGDFYDHAARAVMCEAYRQGMTAEEGYVWFLPTWFVEDWYDTDRYNVLSVNKENIPCTTSQMIQAINGHLSLQHAYFAPDDEIMQENITVGQWRERYERVSKATNRTPSDYAGYAYDAVWTYAYALDELLAQNHSHIANFHSLNTTEKFVEIIQKTDFHGVSGHIKFIDGPSRLSTILVFQWIQKKSRLVGTFLPLPVNATRVANEANGELHLNQSAIMWLNADKSVPSDGSEPPPTCVLDTLASALDLSCEAAIVVANVTGFGFLGFILLVCFIIIKRRYERRVQLTEDYMKALGIDITTVSNASALDKWEIPRDRLVINRKIGEGAFGFVYGGECYQDDKSTWVAVAVKTLKAGSTVEQKLEFLGEAEVMKRFDHKNILKLLGVQTKGEPVSMVMEYMLYGDLKTFLLSRRNLIDERDESDDISSKRLTSMALDIARAISYLAELKYVHRDIACRNCLLTSNRVVKLGDFGMTRSMYENDYYRFNRKGLLPVRWMPPESLALGRFTPASDVWSFGVVLFEIITFGSYPFQGLSNSQVLEYVKGGKTVNIPHGIKPQLETLLLSTWAYEPVKRPQASEIVEFLANNPRIICPCLELPLASVSLDGPDIHEVQLPRKRQKKKLFPETSSPPPELIPLTSSVTTPIQNNHNLLLNII